MINDINNIFLTFHKISNLKMNTVIDFQLKKIGESNGLKELHIKYFEYVFFFYFGESSGLKELFIKYLE